MDKNILQNQKELWQFYTKQEIAEQCFLFLKNECAEFITKKTIFIEPSAWTWSFIKAVKKNGYKIKGFDIDPKYKYTKKMDFLKNNISWLLKTKKNNIIIGNPPFWKRSKLAIEFINKAAEYSNIIWFILPNQFKKYSAQSKLNKDFRLIKEIDLEDKSFYTIGNNNKKKDYKVNCVFQIRIHKDLDIDNKYKNLRIMNKPPIKHEDFYMYQYNNTKQALKMFDNDFDFWVLAQWYGDYNKIIEKREDFNMKKHRLLFKAKNKRILKILKEIDFEKLSKNNTVVPWFRKADIVKEYERINK